MKNNKCFGHFQLISLTVILNQLLFYKEGTLLTG